MIKSNITVGIPFYFKTEPLDLKKAIDSILNQTLKAEYIHLIQDGEVSDELDKLIKKYTSQFNIIKHIVLTYINNIQLLYDKLL